MANVVRSVDRYDVVTHVDSCLLQMFLCEHFFAVAQKPVEYSEVVMENGVSPQTTRGA